jgi:uroporphyrinogen-III synthase
VAEISLAGFTVGITADRRWEEQAELLRRRDARILHGPTIRTLPIGPEEELFSVTERLVLDPPDVVIANTGIGMRAWFAAADSWGIGEALVGSLRSAQIFARGPKASAAVHQAGLDVTARAVTEQMDEVLRTAIEFGLEGKTVAFQRHGDDSHECIAVLRAARATVIEVPVYRWILPHDLEPAKRLVQAVVDCQVQAVTFTSAPAVRNLFLIAEEMGVAGDIKQAFSGPVVPVVVGPVCAAAAAALGITSPVVPDRFRIGPMIRSLTDALIKSGKRSTIVGNPVALNGRMMTIGGRDVALSEREAGLLGALLSAAPKVVTRADLLARLWGPDTDPHVVEVTIARLRKRLGEAAVGIISVPRRGYALRP